MHLRLLAGICLAAAVLSGCAAQPRREPTYESAAANPLIPANYAAAEQLLTQIKGRVRADQPILMATVVNIDALEESSTLGRMISENISARFSQAGYRMIEMKFRNSGVYMKRNTGELLLSRELKEIALAHDAEAVIAGTYAEAGDAVFMNVKIIDPATNTVLAAHDYALPLNASIRPMLQRTRLNR